LEETVQITIDSDGRRLTAKKGQSLLEALVGAGILLRADCGGKGRCAKCKIQLLSSPSGTVPAPDESEKNAVSEDEIAAGYRLACRTSVTGDLTIDIPETSLLAPEVAQKGPTTLPETIPVYRKTPPAPDVYEVAVDLGTTTIAVYLCDINQGKVKASVSMRNPQVIFGDDVMSRITAVSQKDGYLNRLQKMAVSAIDWGIHSLCKKYRIAPDRIQRVLLVGNSTMVHLFVGENPTSIGVFPYDPVFYEERVCPARDVGLAFHPAAEVITLPLISGFLGADIIGATIAAGLEKREQGTVLVDVGTNGEVMLLEKNGFSATSCATGPAFEGASIRHGMHAISGAVDNVRIDPDSGRPACTLIQRNPKKPKKAAGICGSGVVSAVAALYRAGIIRKDGRFNEKAFPDIFIYDENEMPEYILIPGEATQSGKPVTLTQRDVRAIQLAKGALLAGIQLLCRNAGTERISRLLVAGAFGSYIRKEDALTIGMFPDISASEIDIIGNAAGAGAIMALFDERLRQKALDLSKNTKVVDLAGQPDFQDTFIQSLAFPG